MVGRRSRLWLLSVFLWPVWLGGWGCTRQTPQPEEPLGKLPNAVTTAVPEWIPFRIRAGRSIVADPRERRLTWLRQLTDDGLSRAAAWHPSGRAIVIERRGADGCGQLYTLDLSTGATKQVSPESGWAEGAAYGVGDTLLFSHAPAAGPPCPRDESLSLWTSSLHKSDIWALSPEGEPRALIEDPAFDGQPSTSIEGHLVFTSMRHGDPELYVAASDGSGVTRITERAGYDGHARFSPDGTSLVWHGEHVASGKDGDKPADPRVTPRSLRLYLAGNRGQHRRELPSLGRYDVTPAFLPDSQRLLFASDYDADPSEGGAGFELYLYNPDDPESADDQPITERVTFAEGFDGQPVFSPDGQWLLFTSSRRGDRSGAAPGETNVFVALWNEP